MCCVLTTRSSGPAWNVLFTHLFFVHVLVENPKGSYSLYVQKKTGPKTGITPIEKIETNIACNHSQAKYNNLKCKTMNLLLAMTCIVFKTISHFWNTKNWAWNSSPVAQLLSSKLCLRSFGQPLNDYTDCHHIIISLVTMKNRTCLPRPSSRHMNKICICWLFWVCKKVKLWMPA